MKLNLPSHPGVYLFKNSAGKILYVGKALNLRNRVKSYFRGINSNPKINLLVASTRDIDWIQVDSSLEALILEADLIKKNKPKFNTQLKDDKDYLYIKIPREPFPRVLTARKHDLKNAKYFFGPYPSSKSVRTTLKILRPIFPFRTCKVNQGKACFYYHLGLCPGVCVGKINETQYLKNLKNIVSFLNGQKNDVLAKLEKEMKEFSIKREFEKAATVRNQIKSIQYVTAKTYDISEYLNNKYGLENIRERELINLTKILDLKNVPKRIEGYDISNIQGNLAVGSMVVFTEGESDKNEYRRFRIKTVKKISDVDMIKEVLTRRFKNSWAQPDLIIVDGGKAQLNASFSTLRNSKVKTPVVALAKKNEEIFTIERKKPIKLELNSEALHIVQRLRDEAHRFAHSYHSLLRKKSLFDFKS